MTKKEVLDSVKKILEEAKVEHTISEDKYSTNIYVFIGKKKVCLYFYNLNVTVATYFNIGEYAFVTMDRMYFYYDEIRRVRYNMNIIFFNLERCTSFLTVDLSEQG